MEELGRAKVEYVLVGGYAVAFHGRPHATKDIDLVLRGTAENLERTASALDVFGAPPQVVQATRSMRADEVVYLGQPDLLPTIDGVDARDLFRDAVEAEVDGLRFV